MQQEKAVNKPIERNHPYIILTPSLRQPYIILTKRYGYCEDDVAEK